MTFLLRSAFWLGLVFSWLPGERTEMARILSDAKTSFAAHAQAAAKAGCAGSAVACGAVLLAANQALAPTAPEDAAAERAPAEIPSEIKNPKALPAKNAAAKKVGPRPSANSLTAADFAPPWRGRNAKPGV